jgi:Flp pilus assembly protein TadD, contains TPR repeats
MSNQSFDFVAADEKKVYVGLFLLCLLAYANSLGGDFVFDDTLQIVNNPWLEWSNITKAFTTDVWAFQRELNVQTVPPPYYRPLFTVYFIIGGELFGLWQQGWHLMNLAVHIGATFLVFALFRKLSGGNHLVSAFGAVLFALIPIHVESVSWISGVPDPLSSLFFIPAILWYIRWRESGNAKFLILSLLFFLLSLFCKETPIVLPAILFGWEIFSNSGSKSEETLPARIFNAVKPTLIYIVPAIIYLGLRFNALGKISWRHPDAAQIASENIYATVPFVLVSYIKNILFPFNLSIRYGTRFVTDFSDSLLWIPLAVLAGVFALIYFFRKEITPLMWMALALFIIPLLPVLNLKVFHYEYIVQDRYLYLPSIGFVLFVACLLEKLRTAKRESLRKFAPAVFALLCIAYLTGTILQNRVWSSEVALWTRAVSVNPNSWMTHYNLGLAYSREKNFETAEREYTEALKYDDYKSRDHAMIYNNRGLVRMALGKNAEAKNDFLKALEIEPGKAEPRANLGALLFEEGSYAEAEKQFQLGLQTNPSDASLNFNLARTQAKMSRHREAVSIYENLLNQMRRKGDAELMYYAAVSYAEIGEKDKALDLLNKAEKIAQDEKLRRLIEEEKRRRQ